MGTSEWTGYLSVLSIDPATLGVQVMNLVVPASSLTHEPVLIKDSGSLFIILRSGQEVTDYEIASALLRCSSAAPPGLREALEELPPNASPREVLQAIKDWRRGLKERILPLIKWYLDLTGGRFGYPDTLPVEASAVVPPEVMEAHKALLNASSYAAGLGACLTEELAGSSSPTTTIIKVPGRAGFGRPSAAVVQGEIVGESAAVIDGSLVVVTESVPSKVYPAFIPYTEVNEELPQPAVSRWAGWVWRPCRAWNS